MTTNHRLLIFFISAVISVLSYNTATAQHDTIAINSLLLQATDQLDSGKRKDALAKADSALTLSIKIGLNQFIVAAHLKKAECLDALKKPKLVITEYNAALDLAKDDGSPGLNEQALIEFYNYYLSKRKFAEALELHKELALLQNVSLKDENANLILIRDSVTSLVEHERRINQEKFSALENDSKGEVDGAGFVLKLVVSLLVISIVLALYLFLRLRKRLKQLTRYLEKEKQELSEIKIRIGKMRSYLAAYDNNLLLIGENANLNLVEKLATIKSELEQLAKNAGSAIPVDKYLGLQNTVSRLSREWRAKSAIITTDQIAQNGLCESLKMYCENISKEGDTLTYLSECFTWSREFTDDLAASRLIISVVDYLKSKNEALNGTMELKMIKDKFVIILKTKCHQVWSDNLYMKPFEHYLLYLNAEMEMTFSSERECIFNIIVPYDNNWCSLISNN